MSFPVGSYSHHSPSFSSARGWPRAKAQPVILRLRGDGQNLHVGAIAAASRVVGLRECSKGRCKTNFTLDDCQMRRRDRLICSSIFRTGRARPLHRGLVGTRQSLPLLSGLQSRADAFRFGPKSASLAI